MQYPMSSSGSSPNILENDSSDNNKNNNLEEVGNTNENDMKKVQHHAGAGPRALSRSAMVKAVVANSNDQLHEANEIEKPVKNVCLVDKPQIFPATSSMTTRAVIEMSSSSSSAEYPTPNHPKGINRMTRKIALMVLLKTFLFIFPIAHWSIVLCFEVVSMDFTLKNAEVK